MKSVYKIESHYSSRNLPHWLDGPAIIWSDGGKEWWVNGQRHREDGPAITEPNGYQEWHQHGKRHRIDGPAVFLPNKEFEEWFVDDKNITDIVYEWIAENALPSWKEWGIAEKTLFALRFR